MVLLQKPILRHPQCTISEKWHSRRLCSRIQRGYICFREKVREGFSQLKRALGSRQQARRSTDRQQTVLSHIQPQACTPVCMHYQYIQTQDRHTQNTSQRSYRNRLKKNVEFQTFTRVCPSWTDVLIWQLDYSFFKLFFLPDFKWCFRFRQRIKSLNVKRRRTTRAWLVRFCKLNRINILCFDVLTVNNPHGPNVHHLPSSYERWCCKV